MKKTGIVFVLSMIIILLNSCKGKESIENSVSKQDNWKVLDQTEYSISYPKEWTLDTSGKNGTEFLISSPLESDEDQNIQNITMVTENLDSTLTIEEYAEVAKVQLDLAFPNNSFKKEKKKLHGMDFYRLTFSGTVGAGDFKFVQYNYIKNNKAYVVGFTTEKDDFDKDIILGEQILKTFILK